MEAIMLVVVSPKHNREYHLCLNTQGPVGRMKSRTDYPEPVQRIREIKREAEEAGHEIIPTVLPSLQVRKLKKLVTRSSLLFFQAYKFGNDQNNRFRNLTRGRLTSKLLGV